MSRSASRTTWSSRTRPIWAVLDGYGFGRDDEELVRKTARHLLVIDDHGVGGDHGADLVLDQNLGASAAPYGAETLLGPRYALLRREFRTWHAARPRQVPERARRILVALGGSANEGVTSLVTEALAHPSLRDLPVTFLEGVDDVASAMASADLAVSTSGTTCWELCCMGLPAILLPIAANQEPLAHAMNRSRIAQNAGSPWDLTAAELAAMIAGLAADPERRAEMARRGPQLVDGRGARRVVTRMRARLLDLRPVREDDARLLWEWVNDPVVRASACNQEPIGWETHVAWLAERLADPFAHLYLAAHADGTPLGQVRFEGDATDVEISVSVVSSFRGGGWGPALICAAVDRLFEETSVQGVLARIRPENSSSQSAFDDAGFARDVAATEPYLRYTRRRSATRVVR